MAGNLTCLEYEYGTEVVATHRSGQLPGGLEVESRVVGAEAVDSLEASQCAHTENARNDLIRCTVGHPNIRVEVEVVVQLHTHVEVNNVLFYFQTSKVRGHDAFRKVTLHQTNLVCRLSIHGIVC